MTHEQFVADWRTRLAAERLVEIIGEAANRLPDELRDQYAAIPWRQMIGTRNWLVHGYDAVDYQIIWDVLTKHLSLIRTQAQQILYCGWVRIALLYDRKKRNSNQSKV